MPDIYSERPVRRSPGSWFLLDPLGWVRDSLTTVIEHQPALVEPMIKIDRPRMHLVALCLAHARDQITPDFVFMLLEWSQNELVDFMFGHRPIGLARILGRLPTNVLTAHAYRKLIDLLNDGATAKFLHHLPSISEATLVGLYRLPSTLRRPAIMAMVDRADGLDGLVDGLAVIADRTGQSLETLADQIGALDHPNQIAARIRSLIDTLPLPPLPPAYLSSFRRIDCPAELRALGKRWRNCLADCVPGINTGAYLVYLSDRCQAVCLVCRYGRMGWFLSQVKGPRNAAVDPDTLAEIRAAFGKIDVHPASAIEPINMIVLRRDWSSNRLADVAGFHPGLF